VALTLERKQAVVSEVAAIASGAQCALAAEYRGLSVAELSELRASARENAVVLRVVKNTLARRALEGTSLECLGKQLTGPLVLAFAQQDPGAAARVLSDYAKIHDKLVIRLIAIDGRLLPLTDLQRLAKLPTREQAIATLMSTMRAPVAKLVRVLNEIPSKLARTLAAIRDQKGADS
jgi:large subunit ribosomal protein L10